MLFLKEHLLNKNYTWLPEENILALKHEPDRRLFDRLSGNQVLYIINFFGKVIGNLSLKDGQKIEALILKELPAHLKSQIAVFNWLREEYLYRWN